MSESVLAIGAAEPPLMLASRSPSAIEASETVPVPVIGPPVRPVPVATLVTVPPDPAGVAQLPSPRQNVVADADVPELRLVTGRFPVTSAAKFTAAKVGAPAA